VNFSRRYAILFFFLMLLIFFIPGVYGIQITVSGGGNGESGSVSMNFDTLKTTAVSSQMAINGAEITPSVAIAGPIANFEETHAVTDASGKSASVYVKVLNAPSGLTYSSIVLPKEGSVPTQTKVSAEQWLTVPKADSIKCTATSSYGTLSANVGLEEAKNVLVAGDYVTLTEYYGKALTTDTSVLASQTATSGAANSIKIYGNAKDSSGTYSVDTSVKGISNGKATFQGLSDIASAGTAAQVEQKEHLHGSFTSMATYVPNSGTTKTNTRSSNYGTEYDLTMLAKMYASGPSTWGTVGYYIGSPSLEFTASAADNYAARVALRAVNSQYVGANGGGGDGIVANRNAITGWETFKFLEQGNGNVALQAANGQYVCAEGGGGNVVVANRDAIGAWETFKRIDRGNGNVALQAANGQYVCAEGGGGDGVVANRDAIGAWETFNLVDLIGTPVALRANNGQYVCAEGGGWNPDLYANRNVMGDWEKFQLIELGDNKVALKGVNGKYLCAENGGGGSIAPNRDGIGSWETFERMGDGSGGWTFRASNGQLFCAENGGGDKVLANRGAIGSWETFSLEVITQEVRDSIQAAIAAARPGDTIQLKEGIYRQNVNIDKSVNVNGVGEGKTIVDGGQVGSVFTIPPGVTTTLERMTIQNGKADRGGGIRNFGTAKITSCIISRNGNTATTGGGGIFNEETGRATITGSTISGNNADWGGGIFNYGTATITGSTISGNTARTNGGGGIFNEGTATITSSTISGNRAGSHGAGIYNDKESTDHVTDGTLTMTDSTVSGNIAGDHAGGIFNEGTSRATITNSRIIDNTAIHGGGISNVVGGDLRITDSTISGNNAGWGGGFFNYDQGKLFIGGTTQITNNQATTGEGGGIYTGNSLVTLDGTGVGIRFNKARQPASQSSWYQGWGVYWVAPTTTGGFNSATQVTDNTKI